MPYKDREKGNLWRRRYYKKHPEKRRCYREKYRRNNKQKIKLGQRKYYEKNRDKILKRGQQYEKKNWAKIIKRNREYRNTDKGKLMLRNRKFKSKYGITTEDYVRLLEKQKGVCAVCGKPETRINRGKIQTLAVDHCHKTKKIRGLLCQKCNLAIGLLNDSLEIVENLLRYLGEIK